RGGVGERPPPGPSFPLCASVLPGPGPAHQGGDDRAAVGEHEVVHGWSGPAVVDDDEREGNWESAVETGSDHRERLAARVARERGRIERRRFGRPALIVLVPLIVVLGVARVAVAVTVGLVA